MENFGLLAVLGHMFAFFNVATILEVMRVAYFESVLAAGCVGFFTGCLPALALTLLPWERAQRLHRSVERVAMIWAGVGLAGSIAASASLIALPAVEAYVGLVGLKVASIWALWFAAWAFSLLLPCWVVKELRERNEAARRRFRALTGVKLDPHARR